MLSTQKRTEFGRTKHAKAIRVGVYDHGIFIGGLFLADRVADRVAQHWPQYAIPAFIVIVAAALSFLFTKRYKDLKSIEFIEDQMSRDEDEGDA
jgi:hypothetical protein